MKICDIIQVLEKLAGPDIAEGFDNVGLLIEGREKETDRVLVCLDCDEAVTKEAKELGARLVVSHHPLIFSGVKSISSRSGQGRAISKLIENGISLYSMHTNLDSAKGGLNDYLADLLGLGDTVVIESGRDGGGLGRVGTLKEKMPYGEFIKYLKDTLNIEMLRYTGDEKGLIKTVGLCTGSGAEFANKAYDLGADVYITGDVKYHAMREAYENGQKLIDAGHFETEIIAIDLISAFLEEHAAGIEVIKSKANRRPYGVK